MISEKYADMTTKGSIIREFAQYASKRAAEIGKENVYNFTIGNPSVPVCPEFTETLERMLKEENPLTLHGYSPTLGIMSVREAVADSLNRKFGMEYTADDIFMTSECRCSLRTEPRRGSWPRPADHDCCRRA